MKINKILTGLIICQAALMLSGCEGISEKIPTDDDSLQAAVTVIEITTASEAAEPDIIESESIHSENMSEDVTDTEEITDTQITSAQTENTASENEGAVQEIKLTFYSVTLYEGGSRMPIVTMYPEDAPDKSEIWTSSDTDVAVVDDLGNITAVSEGKCTVTVQSAVCPDVSASVEVTVKKSVTEPTYIDGILIVNKSYPLPADYAPGVDSEASAAFEKMRNAAAAEGLNIYISSGYRSYEYQQGLYDRYVARSGQAEADRYSARPGHSEHQTGLAFDLNTIDDSFAHTDEYVWLKEHCGEYGFIIRYPEDGEAVTGYMYEPWHIRYLGVDTALKVIESGLALEDYLGIDSRYDY